MLPLFKKPLFNRDKPASLADSHALRLAMSGSLANANIRSSAPAIAASTCTLSGAISYRIVKRVRMKVTFC